MVSDFLFIVKFWLLVEGVFLIIGLVRACRGKHMLPSDRLYIAPLAIAGLQAGVGLLQGVVGGIQKAKAAKMARANVQPLLKDDPYLDEAYGLAGSRASQGLSDAAKQVYITANDRNLNASLDAVLRGGGNMNNVGDLLDSNSNIVSQLALADEQARINNTRTYLDALNAKANENRDQYLINEYGPWKDRAAMIAGLSEQGANNIWKGINTVGQAAIGYANTRTYGGAQQPSGASGSVAATPAAELPAMSTRAFRGSVNADAMYADPNLLNSANLLNRYFNRPI